MQNQRWYHNDTQESYFFEGEQPDGWKKGRLPKEKTIDRLVKRVSKEALYDYYILENHSIPETMTHFDITVLGHLIQLIKFYDIHKSRKDSAKYRKQGRSHESYVAGGQKSAATQKLSWKNKSNEEKEAWSEFRKQQMLNRSEEQKLQHAQKISNSWSTRPQEEKDLINKKRSNTCKEKFADGTVLAKMADTRKKNRILNSQMLCRSYLEQNVYDKLIALYPDLLYDVYVDERYPFYCDFYIPSLDLFIELNGHPSHGSYPYIKDDPKSLKECYKLYGDWLFTYTQRDPEKMKKAKLSGLNYLAIYPSSSKEMNYEINGFKHKELIDLILQ